MSIRVARVFDEIIRKCDKKTLSLTGCGAVPVGLTAAGNPPDLTRPTALQPVLIEPVVAASVTGSD